MKKIVFILISLFSFLFIKNVSAVEMEISAKSAILVDFNTGKVLYSKNENEPLAMASMTKVMSMLLIMEKIDKNQKMCYDDCNFRLTVYGNVIAIFCKREELMREK